MVNTQIPKTSFVNLSEFWMKNEKKSSSRKLIMYSSLIFTLISYKYLQVRGISS